MQDNNKNPREDHYNRILPTFRRRTQPVKGVNSFGDWREIPLKFTEEGPKEALVRFPRGGAMKILKGVIDPQQQEQLVDEVVQHSDWFRQYRVQNTPEPRLHLVLHSHGSSSGFSSSLRKKTQPITGYQHGHVKMLARPLTHLPQLHNLSDFLAGLFDIVEWKIGVNALIYRDGSDSLGYHADNNQGEQLILSLVLCIPIGMKQRGPLQIMSREVNEGTNQSRTPDDKHPVEHYELRLEAGDAYVMDREMQKHYVHRIDKYHESTWGRADFREIVIVFRDGIQMDFPSDTGTPAANLLPSIRTHHTFGEMHGLNFGSILQIATMKEMGYHR